MRPGPVALALAAVLLAAGCGTGGRSTGGDTGNGKRLFSQECASCHVLADARSRGTSGPNLDHAFGPARRQGFAESTIEDVVLIQIRQAEPPMPEDLVTGQDAKDVAAYVAGVAGLPPQGGDGGAVTSTDGKEIFAQAGCGSCHVLADAGTTGTIGPNLDESAPSVELAIERITNGRGQMPPFEDQLSEEQIRAVAQYVSRAAG
ncbi:MAG: c-type cytochrome [Gaiellaceae bacterium]